MIHTSMQRTRIKMCGMTCADDIDYAISLGVDAIGLIFYEKSARFVSIDQAKFLLQDIPAFVDIVAVFVNASTTFVNRIITTLPIQLLQFHGDEPAEFCAQFKKPYIKSIAAISSETIKNQADKHKNASAILLDTPSLNHGGTGKPFDWSLIPQKLPRPVILAGGLTAENVISAVTICNPYAVDVCSGIEKTSGIKDHDKMYSFVNKLWRRE